MKYTDLSNVHIGKAVEELKLYLETTALSKEDCIRTIFAIEEALLQYQEQFGENKSFALTYGKKWGKQQFAITLGGVAFNPFDVSGDGDDTLSVMQTLMGRMGLFPSWKYTSGGNVISMVIPKVSASPLKKLGASILLAVFLYAITLLLPEATRELIYTYGVTPLSDAFTGILGAVSGPIIFCSIVCSVSGMGDIATFGKIGKSTITALLLATVLIVVASCGWLVFLFPPVGGSVQSENAFFEIYQLLLDVIPSNLFEPFVNSDPMQIVTLAVVVGVALLALQKKVTELTVLFEQCNNVLQYIMENISEQIHIFVFISIFGMLLSGGSSTLVQSYRLLVYLLVVIAIAIVYIVAKGSLKTHVSPLLLLKKMAPSFLIALATASSSAAFSASLKTCKEKLGISQKLADFGVPFGQVIYMPAFAIFFGTIGFYMYDAYDLSISISMVLMLLLLSVILSIALPPVPGGGLIVVNILFLQLGIPDAGLTLAIIFLTLYDFPATAINVSSLQMELLCIAKKLDLLDDAVLRQKS